MRSTVVGRCGPDLVHDIHAFDDLAEHRIAVAVRLRIVKIRVVDHIDEELRTGRVGVTAPCHRQRAALVLQAVATFERDRAASGLFFHVGGKAAALDHEPRNHAMKHGAVVMAALHIGQEVLDGFRRRLRGKLDNDVPQGCLEHYARRRRLRSRGKNGDGERRRQQLSTLHCNPSSNVQRGVRAFVIISRVSASLLDAARLFGCSVAARWYASAAICRYTSPIFSCAVA